MNSLRKLSFNLLFKHSSINNTPVNKRPLKDIIYSFKRGYASTYEGDGKTSATVLNLEATYGLMIVSYSPHGFRLNNKLFVQGPLAIFPNTTLSWQVQNIDEVNEESLALFLLVEPKIDIMVIGVGDRDKCTRERKAYFTSILKKYNIPLEVLPTDIACSTFNFLTTEDRFVGAALIPQLKGYDYGREKLERKDVTSNIFTE